MGERLQSQKSYVCSFFDCKATFSKSWKLEAHLCKHTGLVSVFTLIEGEQNACKRLIWADHSCCIYVFTSRNHSPVRTVTRASALAINSPGMSSLTVGENHTSEPPCCPSKNGLECGLCAYQPLTLNYFPGVRLPDALKALSLMPAWRTTWLESTSTMKSDIR